MTVFFSLELSTHVEINGCWGSVNGGSPEQSEQSREVGSAHQGPDRCIASTQTFGIRIDAVESIANVCINNDLVND